MSRIDFLHASAPVSLGSIASVCRIELPPGVDPTRHFRAAASPDRAGRDDVTVLSGAGRLGDLAATRAGACFVSPSQRSDVPSRTIALVTDAPLEAFLRLAVHLHPDSLRRLDFAGAGIDRAAIVHDEAALESGVAIDPVAVVGPRAEIGRGTTVGSGSVIGGGVRIGRDCVVGALVSIHNALIGDRVVIHAGVRIGPVIPSHERSCEGRLPRLGRVIIQDDAEIGANALIDCGHAADTMIGDGARIGGLVVVAGGTTVERRTFVAGGAVSSASIMI